MLRMLKESWLLIIGFGILGLLFIVMSISAVNQIDRIAEQTEKLHRHPLAVSNSALRAEGLVLRMHRSMKDVVLSENKAQLELAIAAVKSSESAFYKEFDIIRERFLGDQARVDEVIIAFRDWRPIRETVIEHMRAGEFAAASRITKGIGAHHVSELNRRMRAFVVFATGKASEFLNKSRETREHVVSRLQTQAFLLLGFGIIVSSLVTFRLRQINQALKKGRSEYQNLFNSSMVSVWDEDFTELYSQLKLIRQKGITDLSAYLDEQPDELLRLAATIRVNDVNQATVKLFNATDNLNFVQNIDRSFGDGALDVFRKELDAIWNGEKEFRSEATFKTLDDEEFYALINLPIPQSPDEAKSIPFSILDISDRKRSEKALKENEQRLRLIAESQPGVVWMSSPGFHKILYISPAYEQVFGKSLESLYQEPKSLFHAVHPQDKHKVETVYQSNGKNDWSLEYRILRPNQEVRWIRDEGRVVVDHETGEILCLVGVAHDRTDRVEMERALNEQRELNELQKEFISLVSHEFRTPLAVIDSSAQRILRRRDKVSMDEVCMRMAENRNMIAQLTELMESVLSLSRLDAGKINFEPSEVGLVNLIEEVLDEQRYINPTAYFITLHGNVPDSVFADPKLLRVAFSNLLSNAVKYSPEGRPIQISTSLDDDGFIHLSVRDQGSGISENEQQRLFERFFRASNSLGIPGTGIGLSLSKVFMQLHGGDIMVESTLDEGSNFTLIWPYKTKKGRQGTQ